MLIEIRVPSVGESVTEAVLAQWYKNDGDMVKKDEPLFVIETDKVTLEVVAEAAGAAAGDHRGSDVPSPLRCACFSSVIFRLIILSENRPALLRSLARNSSSADKGTFKTRKIPIIKNKK